MIEHNDSALLCGILVGVLAVGTRRDSAAIVTRAVLHTLCRSARAANDVWIVVIVEVVRYCVGLASWRLDRCAFWLWGDARDCLKSRSISGPGDVSRKDTVARRC